MVGERQNNNNSPRPHARSPVSHSERIGVPCYFVVVVVVVTGRRCLLFIFFFCSDFVRSNSGRRPRTTGPLNLDEIEAKTAGKCLPNERAQVLYLYSK